MQSDVMEPPGTTLQVTSLGRRFGFLLLLLISGFCGISYEVLYGRLLSNFVGDQFAVSASILLTFMLGIGFGARIAHRLWPWLWLLECGIGIYAAAAAMGSRLLESWFYSIPFFSQSLSGAMVACFVLLMVPSFLIGCSLPLFAGYLARLSPGGVFARAYLVYNFGAALTVVLIEFVLLRKFGIRSSVFIMATLNALVGMLLLGCFGSLRQITISPTTYALLPRNQLSALVLASIGSAIFQLLMVKIAECFLGPFRQTFALVLCIVLLSIAVGSGLVRRFKLQFSWLLVAALIGLAWLVGGLDWSIGRYSAFHPAASMHPATAFLEKLGLLFLCMGIPSLAFGGLIPALLREQDDVARSSGHLLFLSSVANALGFLLMALVLHRMFDYGVVILVVAGITAVAVWTYAGLRTFPSFAAGLTLMTVLGLHYVRWDEHLLYLGYDRFRSTEELEMAMTYLEFPERFKGNQDVFALNHFGNDIYFFINGYISIALNSPAEKIVGAFPALFSPATDRALVLGVGSGATCGTVTRLFDRVDGVEINPVVLQNLHRMSEHNFDIVTRTNVHFILDDGIHFTKVCQEKYPLIINTVTAPIYFSSSKLYTIDFLQSIRRCLRPGGVYVTWVDARVGDRGLDIILKTVEASGFKECALGGIKSGYFLLLCSDEPLKLRQPGLVRTHPEVAEYFLANGIQPHFLPYGLLATKAFGLVMDETVPVNTLDYPALEFLMASMDDFYQAKWATRLLEKLSVTELSTALEPAMKVDAVELALHTDRLYKDSPLTARRIRLLDDASDDFFDKYRVAKLDYYREWAERVNKPEVRYTYAKELMRQKKYTEAVVEMQKALATNPDFYEGHYTIGSANEQAGNLDQALTNYIAQRKAFPGDKRISLALGRVYYKMNDYARALPLLQQAAKERDYFENYLYLSLTLKALGRADEGEDVYQQGMRFGAKPKSVVETSNGSNPN
ncbi:MAG: putative spermidine synthase with an N-terminal rane domain [Verrucomicrobiales bacterium]|nr:putative spermidine synthase with an N-terminal rane domain [Verrucomicrobiales bacterium]